MTMRVEAVYENGLLRPLEPLALKDHQRVTVVVTDMPSPMERSHLDVEYLRTVKKEVAAMERIPTLEEVHKITSKDPASWSEAIIAEREEQF